MDKTMKVICIDASNPRWKSDPIIEGEVYTVIGESPNKKGWVLAEAKNIQNGHLGYGYMKYRFIPLSDIDETELVTKDNEIFG